jgi:CTD nuclear envelope phosphatase 1
VTQSMQGLYYMNSVKPPNDYLQYRLPETNRSKLAIFDMDETLIHCIPDRKVRSDTGSSDMKQTDVLLKCELSPGRVEYLPVNIRPYIKEAIIHLKQWYQVIVFTASKKEYADPILNYIDPDGTLIETR